jgi:hypothetical protein
LATTDDETPPSVADLLASRIYQGATAFGESRSPTLHRASETPVDSFVEQVAWIPPHVTKPSATSVALSDTLKITPPPNAELSTRSLDASAIPGQRQSLRESSFQEQVLPPMPGITTPTPNVPFKSAETGLRSLHGDGMLSLPIGLLDKLILTELSSREFRVFLAILTDCIQSASGCSELSAAALQDKTQIHRTHIFGAVKALVERGFLLKEKRDNASANRYQINPELMTAISNH